MTDVTLDAQHVPPRLSPGQLVGSRYRLEAIAGAGGMATVWRAHDERLRRPVAIKAISDALAADQAALARFAREARTHARIQHPNLVQVYDYSVTASQPYLVMEYIDGATLSECLDRDGFTPAALDTLTTELLSAIACVHDNGVLHRDIKSANVLLDPSGHARLTDFGLARLDESTHITRPNEVVGTLRYLAPELLEGRPASRQSDLFALGVLLRTAVAHGGASPQLSRLITWLTQHDPEQRPPDAHAALALLQEEPTRQHRVVPTPAPAEDPTRRLRAPEARRPPLQRPVPRRTDPPRADTPQRPGPTTGGRLRSRTIAIAALLVVVLGTAFAVATAGNGAAGGHRAAKASIGRTAATTLATYRRETLDQQLQRLATGVRRAASP